MSTRKRTEPKKDEVVAELERKKQQLKQYSDDDGHFSLVRNFRLADVVTVMNGVCGLNALFSAARFLSSPTTQKSSLWWALAFPVLGFGFDVFDGKIARWMHSSSMLGQEMDSLADLVSFGVAPAFLAFTLGLRSSLDTLLLGLSVACGLARLARFNATVALIPADTTGKIKYFEGLPIPSSLGLVAMMSYWVWNDWTVYGTGLPGGVWAKGEWCELHPVAIVWGVWAASMVSKTLKIPKF